MSMDFGVRGLNERVLALVDHEDRFLHFGLIDFLLKRGCVVFERIDATPLSISREAVSPDLIIVGDFEDWSARRIRPVRKMYPKAKIVLYGSECDGSEFDIDLARSRGFDGYISDEIDEPRLVSLLQHLLAGKCAFPQTTPSLRRKWGQSGEDHFKNYTKKLVHSRGRREEPFSRRR